MEERDSGSVFSELVSGTVVTGAGKFVSLVASLLATMFVVRAISPATFGTFVLLKVAVAFLLSLSGLGFESAIPKYVSSSDDKVYVRKLLNSSLYFTILVVAIVGIVAATSRRAISNLFGSLAIQDYILFIGILFCLEGLFRLLKTMQQSLFRFRFIALGDMVASLLNLALVIGLVVYAGKGISGLMIAAVASVAAACLVTYVAIPIERKLEFHPSILKQLLRFGLPLQLNSILTFFFRRIDIVMIASLMGPAEVALYEVARRIPEGLVSLYDSFRAAFYPHVSSLIAKGKRYEAEKVVGHSVRLVAFVGAFAAMVALVFGEEIIELLFSEEYVESAPVFVLLMAGATLTMVNFTLGSTLVAAGESDKPVFVNLVHSGVALLGNVLLIPIFGIVGTALASIAGLAAKNPLNVFFLRRKDMPILMTKYLKPILLFVIGYLAVTMIKPSHILQKLSILLLFLLASYSISIVTREDFDAFSFEIRLRAFQALRSLRARRASR